MPRTAANCINFSTWQREKLMQFARQALGLGLLGLAIVAPSASATFHEMSIREIYAGSRNIPTPSTSSCRCGGPVRTSLVDTSSSRTAPADRW